MTKKKLPSVLALFLALVFAGQSLLGQRDGRPRRLDQPETIGLQHGARVEFHTFDSKSLGEPMRYSVLIPPSYDSAPDRKFPVVYFLHGMFNDDTSWCVDRYGNIPPLIVQMMHEGEVPEFLMVHPNGENRFYTDSADGTKKVEQYVRLDVIQEIEKTYRTRTDRAGRAIGGTSAGGYGALKIAFKDPGRFATVTAGSPIVLLGDDPTASLSDPTSRGAQFFSRIFAEIYGDPFNLEHWKKNSLERLARTADLGDLNIHLLYGTADRYNGMIPMEAGVRKLQEILVEKGAKASLQVVENGPHGWELVVDHLQEIIRSLTRTF